MTEPNYLDTPQGRRIAYHRSAGTGPGLVFLGGFVSDMEGTKALHLEDWARAQGRAFVRFDYSGHGQSSEDFIDGCVGDWTEDAMAVLEALTEGPQVLVGSSMGGWIALLCARAMPARVAGMVTIAAAPDFMTTSMWAELGADGQKRVMEEGIYEIPSDYDAPYRITRRMIEDGHDQTVLDKPLALEFPVRFLQGTEDEAVETDVALRLLAHATGPDLRLTLVKGADHRFSTPECLALIESSVEQVLAATGDAR
ncbi:alpha/beta fold hydrolase [Fluviibacterium sp. S390]|uniref:alpha/beta fold hydrolase n=1 Tax=Fluviibacterium sp. S390 TaxID=3415139 RepID=UPI003C7DE804